MKASFLVLNIATNLERLCRFSTEGKTERVDQFLKQTDDYFRTLKKMPVNKNFRPTLVRFEKEMEVLKSGDKTSYQWAEKALTWANILTHHAKLA